MRIEDDSIIAEDSVDKRILFDAMFFYFAHNRDTYAETTDVEQENAEACAALIADDVLIPMYRLWKKDLA